MAVALNLPNGWSIQLQNLAGGTSVLGQVKCLPSTTMSTSANPLIILHNFSDTSLVSSQTSCGSAQVNATPVAKKNSTLIMPDGWSIALQNLPNATNVGSKVQCLASTKMSLSGVSLVRFNDFTSTNLLELGSAKCGYTNITNVANATRNVTITALGGLNIALYNVQNNSDVRTKVKCLPSKTISTLGDSLVVLHNFTGDVSPSLFCNNFSITPPPRAPIHVPTFTPKPIYIPPVAVEPTPLPVYLTSPKKGNMGAVIGGVVGGVAAVGVGIGIAVAYVKGVFNKCGGTTADSSPTTQEPPSFKTLDQSPPSSPVAANKGGIGGTHLSFGDMGAGGGSAAVTAAPIMPATTALQPSTSEHPGATPTPLPTTTALQEPHTQAASMSYTSFEDAAGPAGVVAHEDV